jgi:hypothetical protein
MSRCSDYPVDLVWSFVGRDLEAIASARATGGRSLPLDGARTRRDDRLPPSPTGLVAAHREG